ncbi:hypothetical protein L484_002377 [Morus notabilis]|uniref:GUN4-like domain-containing protein n=1 Tax=Morus notabilis TaxID=981085 RepID=W9S611_9ROSA|nr:tetrapyrrole-binding protein, chloroplastic [Morus notabilis]EXC17141.1 hypothetical protein L484_002377 [Morus notabilis]
MATNTLHSIPHNHHSLLKRHHSSDAAPSLFLKPTTTPTTKPISLSSSTLTFSLSPNTTTSSSFSAAASSTSLDLLRSHLAAGDFRQADEETRRLLIALAGDAAQKRGYVFFSEVQYITESDLKAIDELWRTFSDGKFGYSVQKKIFNKVNNDFTRFFIKVGWMKKLATTEVEQYNYRSFPTEFFWEIDGDTPEGHLPLTNALRGTQLLKSILAHPAFNDVLEEEEEEEDDEKVVEGVVGGGLMKGLMGGGEKGATSKGVFKPDYSF